MSRVAGATVGFSGSLGKSIGLDRASVVGSGATISIGVPFGSVSVRRGGSVVGRTGSTTIVSGIGDAAVDCKSDRIGSLFVGDRNDRVRIGADEIEVTLGTSTAGKRVVRFKRKDLKKIGKFRIVTSTSVRRFKEGVNRGTIELLSTGPTPSKGFPIVTSPRLANILIRRTLKRTIRKSLVLRGSSVLGSGVNYRVTSSVIGVFSSTDLGRKFKCCPCSIRKMGASPGRLIGSKGLVSLLGSERATSGLGVGSSKGTESLVTSRPVIEVDGACLRPKSGAFRRLVRSVPSKVCLGKSEKKRISANGNVFRFGTTRNCLVGSNRVSAPLESISLSKGVLRALGGVSTVKGSFGLDMKFYKGSNRATPINSNKPRAEVLGTLIKKVKW